MPKRLAITISGAVSLGSYEAGVLYEVIHAIGEHNLDKATKPDERIDIDVLTGASAGAMTATIAAQKLAFEAGALSGPYDNCFYRPWVADVNLDGLLAMHAGDDATKSILSSQFVVDISRRYLTQRYRSHVDPPRQKHPASAPLLRLGLALGNLNGIDYGVPLQPQKPDGTQNKFTYTRHQDELVTWVEANKPEADDILDFWEPLRNAAVSSGAFAFAFRVVDVVRHASEFADKSDLLTGIPPTTSFAYTDGGTFQNEPLGLAKNLVDLIDNHLDTQNRFYLFVAPDAKSSTANSDFNSASADYRGTALRLVSSIFEQSRFQDWVTAENVNSQVALFNARAEALRRLLDGSSAVIAKRAKALQSAADELLPELLSSTADSESADRARQRLKNQFQNEYSSLPAATRNTFIDSLLTLEAAAQLATRDEMTIFGITAEKAELASHELCSFAGFFDRRYRDHDYDVGRSKAQAFLASPGALGPVRYTPEPIRAIDASLNGLTLQKMDRNVRIAVRDRLCDRAHEILKEAGINPFLIGGAVREVIDQAFIKPQLNKLLML